jgi:hypothetical protein
VERFGSQPNAVSARRRFEASVFTLWSKAAAAEEGNASCGTRSGDGQSGEESGSALEQWHRHRLTGGAQAGEPKVMVYANIHIPAMYTLH